MFAGIVEQCGLVRSVRDGPGGRRLTVDVGLLAADAAEGASLAVDGVCLTVARRDGSQIDFDVIPETLRRSTLGRLRAGGRVNLERSLRAGDRIDGHFVQGHVDGVATVIRKQVCEGESVLWLALPQGLAPYIVPKGSVALAGVSLTIAAVAPGEFSVALIPTTLSRTTLGDLEVGAQVNVETDILVRTVVHTLKGLTESPGLTEAKLREHGYL